MKICIVGCGSVGSLFAANLARVPDVEVWAFDSWEAHVRSINSNGLRISGGDEFVAQLQATTKATDIPPCDFGIVATKSMDTASALAATRNALEGAAVCTIQNGAGNEEIISEYVREVIRGTTFPAGHVVEPGHVHWDTKGDTHIGPFEPSPAPLEKVTALAEVCTRAGMPTHALPDARGAQWRKLIFNAGSNAVGALTGLTHGETAEFEPTRLLATAIMNEGKAVAATQGIVLDTDPEELFDFAARRDVAYSHRSSMLQDVQSGRATEIDFLNGAIVAFGDRHGIETPFNRAITNLIKGLERGQ